MFIGDTADEREQRRRDANRQGCRPAAYHRLTVRNHDWLLRTDTGRLVHLLGHGKVRDRPGSWLLPPPPTSLTEPEMIQPEVISLTSSASVDWRSRRRRLASPRRAANDDNRRSTHVDVLPTSNYWQSEVRLPSAADCETAASTTTMRSSPGVDEGQPLPVYPPLLSRFFPTTSSTSSGSLVSSSLAYEMLATAALSSLRHALPFASLLPPSSTSCDVISAAAAAAVLLQPQSHQFNPFAATQMIASSSLGQPVVDHGDRASAGSVLDLVVAPSGSDPTAGDDRGAVDKHSPRLDRDGDLSAVSPRPRGCVWRPY